MVKETENRGAEGRRRGQSYDVEVVGFLAVLLRKCCEALTNLVRCRFPVFDEGVELVGDVRRRRAIRCLSQSLKNCGADGCIHTWTSTVY